MSFTLLWLDEDMHAHRFPFLSLLLQDLGACPCLFFLYLAGIEMERAVGLPLVQTDICCLLDDLFIKKRNHTISSFTLIASSLHASIFN